jgi:hypothetical protein
VQSAQGQTVQREEVPEEEEQVQAKSISNTIQREEVPEEEQLQAKSISDTIQREEVPEEEEQVQAKSISNTIQREEVTEEEQLQAKSISDTIQREEVPEEEEQVQAKSISDTIQREELPEEEQLQGKSLKGEMAATPNLETSIQGAKGSGQPLDENIRQPMEKAFGGVDFSQVKVHNDTQSDQLNKSIQARAFTTGTDVFFRGGEYNPGSRGGQELIAHELTHVVQQNSNSVARKVNSKNSNNLQLKRIKNPVVTSQINTIQRGPAPDQGQGTEQSKQALKAQFAQDAQANDLKQKLQTANKEKEKAVNVQSQLKSAASQAGVEAPEMGQLGEVPDANQALQEMNAAPEKLTAGIQSSGSPQAQPVMRKAEDSAVNQVSFNTSKPVIQRGLWGSIKKGFKKVGGAIASGAKAVGGAVVSGAKAVGGAVVDGAKWIGDKAAQGWNALKEGASKAWNAVKSAASKAWNAVTSWVGKVFAIAKAWIQKQIAKAKQKLTQVAMKATGMKDKMGALLEATNEKYGLTKKLKAGTQTAKEKIKGFGKTAANFGLAAAEGAGKALAGPIRPGWWTDKADEYKQLWSKENKGAYGEGKLGDVMRVLKTLDMTLGNVGEIAGWVSLITAIAAPIAGAFGVTAPLVPILGSISVVAAQITAVTALIRLALNAILAIYNLIRLTMAKDPEEKAKIQAAFFGDLTTIALSALSAGGVGKAGQKAKDSMNTLVEGNGKTLGQGLKEGWKNNNLWQSTKGSWKNNTGAWNRTKGLVKDVGNTAEALITDVTSTQGSQALIKIGIPIATGAGKQVYKDFSKKDSTVQKKADVTNLVQKQDTGEQTNDGMSAQLQQAIMTATQNMEMSNQQAQTEQDGEIKSLSDMENKAQEMNNGTENMKKEASKESAAKV